MHKTVLPTLVGVLVLACGIGAPARLDAAQAPSAPKPTRSTAPVPKPMPPAPVLEGTVVGPDGKPLEKALVVVRSAASRVFMFDPPLSTRTDAKGSFRLPLKSKGLVDVRVEAPGLAGKTLERTAPGTPLRIALGKGGTITGVVKDAGSGAPIAGARVWATERRGTLAPTWEAGAGEVEARTDAHGRFKIEGLAAGAHTVRAAARGYSRAQRNLVPLDGKTELLLFPGASLSGTVRDAADRPVAGALLRLSEERFRPGGPPGGLETTDAGGRFEFVGLEAGTYTVITKHKDYAPQATAAVTVERGGDASVDVTLQAPVRITGRLLGEDQRPVAGRIQVQETEGREVPFWLAELLRTEAGSDGRFVLEGVAPGPLTFAVRANGFVPKRVDADVRSGETAQDVGEIALEAGLSVRGMVRSRSGPVPDATIRGFVRMGMGEGQPETRSEGDGSFVLAGLKPGSYELRVDATGYGQLQKPVEAGAEKVDLLLEVAGSITGIVVDEADRPLQDFGAEARAAERGGMMRMMIGGPGPAITITPEGRFTLADITPGSYVVQVTAPDRASGTVSGVKVTAGATADVGKIRLGPGGSIRGTVVDVSGAGILGAIVNLGDGTSFAVPGPEGVTDASGGFELRGLDPGLRAIQASHPQYAVAVATGIDVDPTKGPAEARIVMSQGGRIEGRALRRDGRPIASARVMITRARSGGMFFGPGGMITVGEDGSFVAEHVEPGRVMVALMVGSAGRFATSRSLEVDVRDGETTPVEFQDREILVTGRVTRSGQPAANLRLSLRGGDVGFQMSFGDSVGAPVAGPQRGTAITREDGAYEMLADKPGKSYVTVAAVDGSLTVGSREVEIPDVETHVLDLNFTGQTVAGLVVDRETEKPVLQAYISASRKKGSGSGSPGEGGGSAQTRADGRFQMELMPGEYVVSARAEGYAPASAEIAVGSAGVPDVRLTLTHGESLKGRVADTARRPVRFAAVVARPSEDDDQDWNKVLFGQTLADGSFELFGLEARPYTLTARDQNGGFAVRNSVSPGGPDVTLTLRPGGTLQLRILDAGGAPVEGARAGVEKVGNLSVPLTGAFSTSDAQGTVQLSVPAGNLEIRAFKDKRAGRLSIAVPEQGTAAGEVRLAEPANP